MSSEKKNAGATSTPESGVGRFLPSCNVSAIKKSQSCSRSNSKRIFTPESQPKRFRGKERRSTNSKIDTFEKEEHGSVCLKNVSTSKYAQPLELRDVDKENYRSQGATEADHSVFEEHEPIKIPVREKSENGDEKLNKGFIPDEDSPSKTTSSQLTKKSLQSPRNVEKSRKENTPPQRRRENVEKKRKTLKHSGFQSRNGLYYMPAWNSPLPFKLIHEARSKRNPVEKNQREAGKAKRQKLEEMNKNMDWHCVQDPTSPLEETNFSQYREARRAGRRNGEENLNRNDSSSSSSLSSSENDDSLSPKGEEQPAKNVQSTSRNSTAQNSNGQQTNSNGKLSRDDNCQLQSDKKRSSEDSITDDESVDEQHSSHQCELWYPQDDETHSSHLTERKSFKRSTFQSSLSDLSEHSDTENYAGRMAAKRVHTGNKMISMNQEQFQLSKKNKKLSSILENPFKPLKIDGVGCSGSSCVTEIEMSEINQSGKSSFNSVPSLPSCPTSESSKISILSVEIIDSSRKIYARLLGKTILQSDVNENQKKKKKLNILF